MAKVRRQEEDHDNLQFFNHYNLLLDKQLILCNILIYNMVYLRNFAKETNWEQRI